MPSFLLRALAALFALTAVGASPHLTCFLALRSLVTRLATYARTVAAASATRRCVMNFASGFLRLGSMGDC